MSQLALKLYNRKDSLFHRFNPSVYLQNYKISRFVPKLKFQFETNGFIVKTAQTQAELLEVLRLRHEIFYIDRRGQALASGLDFDKYDIKADHVLLIEKESQKVVGTYRILSSENTTSFYSENEFELDKFLELPGLKLELGRACIHPEFRKGMAIQLVWKGLGRYATLTNAHYMFGCTSIWETRIDLINNITEHLGDDYDENGFNIKPRFRFRFYPKPRLILLPANDISSSVPALLKSYLKAGAKVYGRPAFDQDFQCFDLFTVMNLRELPQKYVQKFMGLE